MCQAAAMASRQPRSSPSAQPILSFTNQTVISSQSAPQTMIPIHISLSVPFSFFPRPIIAFPALLLLIDAFCQPQQISVSGQRTAA